MHVEMMRLVIRGVFRLWMGNGRVLVVAVTTILISKFGSFVAWDPMPLQSNSVADEAFGRCDSGTPR